MSQLDVDTVQAKTTNGDLTLQGNGTGVVNLGAGAKLDGNPIVIPSVDGLASASDFRNLALQVADVKGAALNFTNGQADPYDSDTLATKTNATYDATNDYYTNLSTVAISGATGTNQGDGSGTLANAFDGNESQARASAYNSSGNNVPLNVGKFYSGGRTITGYRAVGRTDHGFIETSTGTFTMTLYGSNSGFKTGGVVLDTYEFTDTQDALEIDRRNIGSFTYDYFWLEIPASGSGTQDSGIGELVFYEAGTPGNATLVPSPVTASSAPDTAYVTVQANPVDSITLNTDLVAEVSRDGGTTWSTVTLAAGATNSSFINYEGTVDVSGQPSGTSMVIRITTANNKEIQVSGHVLRWT